MSFALSESCRDGGPNTGRMFGMFGEDAIIGSKVLEITLTSRDKGKKDKVPLAGVPWHALDSYLPKLLSKGYKVAICEQMTKPGEGRIWACLKSHEAELSQPCMDHIAMMREKGKEFNQACKDDAKKLCKGIPRGKGRIVSCLKSHEAELTEPCKAYFTKN